LCHVSDVNHVIITAIKFKAENVTTPQSYGSSLVIFSLQLFNTIAYLLRGDEIVMSLSYVLFAVFVWL